MADPNVYEAHFRDLDKLIISREAAAVNDWKENSDATFHVMRDHPSHTHLIPPGQFGYRRYGNSLNVPEFTRFLKDTYEKMMLASKQIQGEEDKEKILIEAFLWAKME